MHSGPRESWLLDNSLKTGTDMFVREHTSASITDVAPGTTKVATLAFDEMLRFTA